MHEKMYACFDQNVLQILFSRLQCVSSTLEFGDKLTEVLLNGDGVQMRLKLLDKVGFVDGGTNEVPRIR